MREKWRIEKKQTKHNCRPKTTVIRIQDDRSSNRSLRRQMRPVKPKNDDEEDCRRSSSKRSDTSVAGTELSPLWLPGAQSLELSIESSSSTSCIVCMCVVHAKLRHVKTRMRASLEGCQAEWEREEGTQRVVALWKPMPKHIKLMSLKTPAAAVNSLKRLQESKASKSCSADEEKWGERERVAEKRPFVDVFVVFFFAMWLLAVCVWNECGMCVWLCVCAVLSVGSFSFHSLLLALLA